MYDIVQLYTTIPRTFQAMAFLIYTIKLNKKIKSEKFKIYSLQSVFRFTFLSWFIYMLMDIITPIIIAISIDETFISTIDFNSIGDSFILTLDNSNIISMQVASFLRDIQMLMITIFIFLTLLTVVIIQKSEQIFLNIMKKWYFYVICVIFVISAIILIIFNDVAIQVTNTGQIIAINYYHEEAFIGIYFDLIILSFCFIVILFNFIINIRLLGKKNKRKLLNLAIGYFLICMGLWYWVTFTRIYPTINPVAYQIIGHTIWSLSPIFFYMGLRKGDDNIKIKEDQ